MMQKILLFTALLLLNGTANALGLRTVVTVDTIVKPIVIVPDSLYRLDSSQYEKRQIGLKGRNKSLKIITGMFTGAIAIYHASQADGYPMLFFGLFSIAAFLATLRVRKPKPFDDYLKDKAIRDIKKEGNPKYNNAWSFSLLFGFIGLIMLILAFLYSTGVFAILSLFSILFALIAFFLGFKGKYNSQKEKNKGILKGFLGIALPFLPILVLLILLSMGGKME
jgi:hypothetical protein